MNCYVYILQCSNESYYTGSTKFLESRLKKHFSGLGANHTKKFPPQAVVYLESFDRIDYAFNREHQIKKWTRAKKKALISGNISELKKLARCLNETSHIYFKDKYL